MLRSTVRPKVGGLLAKNFLSAMEPSLEQVVRDLGEKNDQRVSRLEMIMPVSTVIRCKESGDSKLNENAEEGRSLRQRSAERVEERAQLESRGGTAWCGPIHCDRLRYTSGETVSSAWMESWTKLSSWRIPPASSSDEFAARRLLRWRACLADKRLALLLGAMASSKTVVAVVGGLVKVVLWMLAGGAKSVGVELPLVSAAPSQQGQAAD